MEIILPCHEHSIPSEGWYRKKQTIWHRPPRHGHILIKKSYAQHRAKQRGIRYYSSVYAQLLSHAGSSDFSLTIDIPDRNTLEYQFKEQAEKWQCETEHLSSPTQRIMHPSYQAILGMGKKVVPFLLNDLQQNRRPWFWALSYITQENPINPKDAGRMDKMIEAWVKWGKDKGIL